MHDVSDVQIRDSDVKSTIQKLRSGERFESVAFAEKLASFVNKDIDNYYKQIKTDVFHYFEENYDEFWDDFFSGFSQTSAFSNSSCHVFFIFPSTS